MDISVLQEINLFRESVASALAVGAAAFVGLEAYAKRRGADRRPNPAVQAGHATV